MPVMLVGSVDPTARAEIANTRARDNLGLLKQELSIDEAIIDNSDRVAIREHIRAYSDFPMPLAGGVVRIACPSKEEYVSSAVATSSTRLLDVWSAPFGLGMITQILFSHPRTLPAAYRMTQIIPGRWWPNRDIMIGVQGQGQHDDLSEGRLATDWERMNAYTDISKLVLRYIDAHFRFRRLRPKTFRQMIFAHRIPPLEDFTWLTIDDAWALREQCKRMRWGTWPRMRRWLLRRQLAEPVRRALGGRPGRSLAMRKRNIDTRAFRRVQTNRKRG